MFLIYLFKSGVLNFLVARRASYQTGLASLRKLVCVFYKKI